MEENELLAHLPFPSANGRREFQDSLEYLLPHRQGMWNCVPSTILCLEWWIVVSRSSLEMHPLVLQLDPCGRWMGEAATALEEMA